LATTFYTPINNIRTTLQSAHTSGSGTLAVATGTGVNFGSTFPLRVTAVTAATYGSITESLTVFSVTARATDSLTVSVIEGSSDQNYSIGDVVEMRITAGSLSDLDGAVNNLENHIAGVTAHAVMLGEGTTTPGAATIGTAGRVLTDQGAGADPLFAAPPVSTSVTVATTVNYTLTASFATVTGFTLTLPATGTYLLWGCMPIVLVVSSTAAGDYGCMNYQMLDTTNSITVASTTLLYVTCPVVGISENTQQTVSFGPFQYAVTGPATIVVQAQYAKGGTSTISTGLVRLASTLTALRIY
jgi:hypothetical protein